jgi:hypothetical protein
MAAALNARNALSAASTTMRVGSLVHRVCRLNDLRHRAAAHAAALFNTLLGLAGPAADLAVARYSLRSARTGGLLDSAA